jgi:hypothetical protein
VGDFDYFFIFNGTLTSGQTWTGLIQSIMYFTGSKWRIQSLRDSTSMFEIETATDFAPLGRQLWRTGPESSICNLEPGSPVFLTYSTCYPYGYTCNSGDCVPLSSRCDNKMDCSDHSDEANCRYIFFSDSYLKQMIPTVKSTGSENEVTEGPQIVYVNATIKTFSSIDTVGFQFTADFYLNLRWFDSRLTFNNLVYPFLINRGFPHNYYGLLCRGRTYPLFEDIISYPYPGPQKGYYILSISRPKKGYGYISYILCQNYCQHCHSF